MTDRTAHDAGLATVEPVSPDEFLAPPTITHYEPGPETTRMVERNGILWAVTYHAEHDGTGWLVKGCDCRPIEGSQKFFHEGGILHVRVKASMDFGPVVEILVDSPDGARRLRIHRSDIMHVEMVQLAGP